MRPDVIYGHSLLTGDTYIVTNGSHCVDEHEAAYYASIFPDTIYYFAPAPAGRKRPDMSIAPNPNWNTGAPIPADMDESPVSQVMAMFWDGGDPWGSAMAEAFALCDFVTFYLEAQDEIPAEMGYRPSPIGADTEDPRYEELVYAFEHADYTAADAFAYLPILNRYLDTCRAAGLDY